MDGLITTFLAALLAEMGDKTQILVAALAVRYGKPKPILLGIAVAALASSLLAAFAGSMLHGFITARATAMLVALALVFAAVGGFIGAKPVAVRESWTAGPFLAAFGAFFLVEMGDKTQVLTAALAAHFGTFVFAAAGATAGVIVANVPAALLGDRLGAAFPMKSARIGVAILFLLAGFLVAINALRLV